MSCELGLDTISNKGKVKCCVCKRILFSLRLFSHPVIRWRHNNKFYKEQALKRSTWICHVTKSSNSFISSLDIMIRKKTQRNVILQGNIDWYKKFWKLSLNKLRSNLLELTVHIYTYVKDRKRIVERDCCTSDKGMVVKVVNSYCSCKSKGEREWIENCVCSIGESSHPLTYSLDFIKKSEW